MALNFDEIRKKNNIGTSNSNKSVSSLNFDKIREKNGISTNNKTFKTVEEAKQYAKVTQPAVYPRWEDQVVALQNNAKQNEEKFKVSLPVSSSVIGLYQDKNSDNKSNKFITGINPQNVSNMEQAKKQAQEVAYNSLNNLQGTKALKEYTNAKNQYEKELPKADKDTYLDYKALADNTDLLENPRGKAINDVLAEKSKQHSDFYYGLAQIPKTIATHAADAFVNVGQFAKEAFKDQSVQDERKAWNTLATFTGDNAVENTRRQFKAFKNLSDEEIQQYIDKYVADAKQVLSRYNVTVPDNVTPEYALAKINELNDFITKENKVEEFTRTTKERIAQQNQALPEIYKKINNAVGTVAEMTPTIATNAVLPGAGMGTMFMGSAQGSTEEALKQGATYEQARARGILSGALEVGTEMIGGENVAKLTGIPTVMNKLGLTNSNKIVQTFMDINSEGLEEVVSTVIQPFIDRATINPNAELATAKDIWQAYEESILPTLMFSGINVAQDGIANYREKAIQKVQESNMTPQQKQQEIAQINRGAQELQSKVQNVSNMSNIAKNNAQNSVDSIKFAEQVDKWKNNQWNKDSHLTVLEHTPQLYQELGISDLPITVTPSKLERIYYSSGKQNGNYHNLNEIVKQIPEALKHPLNIVESATKNDSIVVITELSDNNGNIVVVPLALDGKGRIEIDDSIKNINANAMTSAYGKSNYDYNVDKQGNYYDGWMKENLKNNRIIYDIDDGIIKKRVDGQWLQLPNDTNSSSVSSTTNTSINNILPLNQNYVNKQQENFDKENSNQGSFSLPENIEQPQTSIPTNVFEETNKSIQQNRNNQIADDTETLTLGKTKKIQTPVEITNMTEEDVRNERGVNYKHKKDKNTDYTRKFFENVESSNIISQQVKDRVDMTTYERKSNESTLNKVNEKLEEQGEKLIKQWQNKTKNFTDEDVALGAILVERYQKQGDIESAVDVVQKLADMGTEAGRAVQMYSIFQRLTPDAMMVYQQRKLNDVFNDIKQKKTGEWVEKNKEKFKLTSEDAQFIQEQVEKAQKADSEEVKQRELSKIENRINDKLPPEAGQTIKALRRIAMLFNPKTQVRNIVGNSLIMPVNATSDFIGTQIDKAIAKKTGVRTTNYTNIADIGKGMVKGVKDAITDYKTGTRTSESGSKYEFEFGAKAFNENTNSKTLNAINNKLNGINNLLSAVMSGGDRPFYEAAYKNSLEGQMKANNVKVPTQEMIDIAVNEALSRTWNDSNSYTQAVLGVRSAMNKLNIRGFGLGDLIIPFAKTPANLTKAMVEYSPLGAIESLIDYNDMRKAISRGEMTPQQQKKFVTSTSKAIAGTILYAIAGSLVKSGAVTGSTDKDKDVANFEKNVLGIQPYSIKIGDRSYTYSWANPINAPLAIMADTYKMSKENASKFEILSNAFKVAGDTLVENSFMQGIKELFEADSLAEALVEAIADLPNQFIPTFLQQLANLGDSNKRQTFEYKDLGKTTINTAKSKIPGLKNTLAPQVNTFGEEIQNYGGDNNPFNIFLNPANVSETVATDTQKELYSLYEITKDKTIFPRQAPYYVSGGGEKVNLSSQDRTEYQKTSGKYVTENLDALFDSEFYKSLDNNKKVEVVKEIVSDADTIAKDKWVDTSTTENLAKRKDELGDIPLADYYNAWIAQKGIESDKNWKGKTITNSKSKKQKEAVDKAISDNLTQEQKERLYGIFNISEKVW